MGALSGEEFLECDFYMPLILDVSHLENEGLTVYRVLVRSIVAHPLARAVAPVAALHPTGAGKVPAIVSRRRVDVHVR